ncbi:MAG TPA: efflux RND transporter periplasmic adaptor subunit [Opitutaceae bacterium]|nr:efflux RND transporter periplasmic adaptor subunit [Opitutaceae bacterium]
MDIARPDLAKKRKKKRLVYALVGGLALVGITVALSRLKPAAPTVERNLVWIDTVKRGPMVRQVRGLGTLVPEEIRWIAARTQGRVERIILRPGAQVTPDSVILELSNPNVVEAFSGAESELLAAEARLTNLKITLERSLLDAETAAAQARAQWETSKLEAEVNAELFKDGLVSKLDLRRAEVNAEQTRLRNDIEQKKFAFLKDSITPQLAVQEAEVSRLRAQVALRKEELDALKVKSSMVGVLSALPVEVGAQVNPGTNLARVADPTRLKAEVRIAETQAKDIALGQLSIIDTRNGVVEGRVARIDPAVQNGTVLVDITLGPDLPRGARPDLSVDGTIELERLDDVIFVGRPAFGQERSNVGIFKLTTEDEAVRTTVQLGRSSVNTIEIVSGLQPGDRVILSDMSPWDSNERIRLN